MNIFALPSMAAFIISLLLGTFVYYKNPYNPINRLFMLLCILSSYQSFAEFMLRTAYDFDSAMLWRKIGGAWPLLISVIVHFIVVLVGRESFLKRPWVLAALYGPAIAFVGVNITESSESRIPVFNYWGWSSGVPNRIAMIWAFSLLLISILIITRYYAVSPPGRKKKQAFYMLISFAIPVLMAYVINILNMLGFKLPEMFTVSYIAGSAFIAYAIWKYELFILSPKTTGESIVRTMSDALMIVLPDGLIATINGACASLTGFKPEELEGRPAKNMFYAENSVAGEYKNICDRLSVSGDLKDYETRLVKKNGTYVPVSVSMSAIFSHGRKQGFTIIARDITERVRTREELMKAKERAEAANRTKSLFLANMSHEIRTPMNSILGFTSILRESEKDPEKSEMLEIINRSGMNLLNLINDILDFSKIEAGKVELEKISFSLGDLLKDLRNMFLLRASEKDIDIRLHIKEDVPDYVFGDEHRINQIVMNLLSNAVKFTREGSIDMICSYEAGTMVLSVKDTGIGIPLKKRSLVFTAFRQGDVSTTREFGGTGLGLAITKRLVETMGGEIELYSEEGKGSEFVVILPLPEVKRPYADDVRRNIANKGVRHEKIAIVENNDNDLMIIQSLLKKHGYRSVAIDNNRNVVENTYNENADLVLLDIKMEGLNGFQINDMLKADQRTAHIPVVVCSIIDDIAETINYGVFDYIRKPLDESEFIRRIRTALVTNGNVKNVYVIDDDKDVLSLYKSILHANRYNVFVFDNALSALNDIQKGIYPDMILLDLMMPEMDGFEFLGILREKIGRADIPVVIATAKDLDKGDIELLNEKCLHVFSKNEDMSMNLIDFLNDYFRRKTSNGEKMVGGWVKSGDGDKALEKILLEGVKKLPLRMTEIQRILNENNLPELKKVVHDMKGFTGNYGMTEIYRIFKKMDEELGSAAPDMKKIHSLFFDITEFVSMIPDKYLGGRAAGKIKLLVAEDNEMNQKLIGAMLKKQDVAYDTVSNGIETLDALRASAYDALLLDIQMPLMDGFETIRQIRADSELAGLYVIALTAYAIKGDEEKCLAEGCDDYISKPIDKELFQSKVEYLKGLCSSNASLSADDIAERDFPKLEPDTVGVLSAFLKEVEEALIVFIPEEIKKVAETYLSGSDDSFLSGLGERFTAAADDYNDEKVRSMIQDLKERYF